MQLLQLRQTEKCSSRARVEICFVEGRLGNTKTVVASCIVQPNRSPYLKLSMYLDTKY